MISIGSGVERLRYITIKIIVNRVVQDYTGNCHGKL